MLARIEAGQQSLAQTFYKSVETVVSDHDYLDNVTTIYVRFLIFNFLSRRLICVLGSRTISPLSQLLLITPILLRHRN